MKRIALFLPLAFVIITSLKAQIHDFDSLYDNDISFKQSFKSGDQSKSIFNNAKKNENLFMKVRNQDDFNENLVDIFMELKDCKRKTRSDERILRLYEMTLRSNEIVGEKK